MIQTSLLKRTFGGLLLGFALLASLPACTPMDRNSGYVIDEARLSKLRPGISTKRYAEYLLGTPSLKSDFEVERWHYVSKKAEQTSVLDPEVKEHNVVTLEFDDEGVLTRIEAYGTEDWQPVAMVGRKTPTEGQSESALEQILGNFGRFTGNGDSLAE